MNLRESIVEIVQSLISEEYFIVEVSDSGSGGRQKITVLLDGDDGITIEKCAEVSRRLGNEIEKQELIDQNFLLEVSSPGADSPLKFSRQYKKNIGRKLKVQLEDEITLSGTLMGVNEDSIIIEAEFPVLNRDGKVQKNKKTLQETEIPFNKIKKTSVIISFN